MTFDPKLPSDSKPTMVHVYLAWWLRFNYYDTQWAKVDAGGYFNVSYIVESLLLPMSFFMHIACYIQKKNGK